MSRSDPEAKLDVVRGMALAREWVWDHEAELSDADVPGTMFDYLRKVRVYGTLENIPTMVGNAILSAGTDATQYLLIIGPVGIGKTETLIRISHFLDYCLKRTGLADCYQQTVVTSEDAQWAGQKLKRDGKFIVDPDHYSGFFSAEDYKGGTRIFAQALKMAGREYQFVLAEAPCSAGYEIETISGKKRLVGNDRCTSAVRDLSRHEGIFEGSSNLLVAALTADPRVFKANLDSRRGDRGDRIAVAERPGGTVSGTAMANQELVECCISYFLSSGSGIIEEKLLQAEQIKEFMGIDMMRLLIWSDYVAPWLLGEYFAVQPEYAGIFENYQRLEQLKSVVEHFKPDVLIKRSYIHSLHEHRPKDFKALAEYP